MALGEVRQGNGKLVSAWAVEGDLDAAAIVSQHLRARVAAAVGRRAEFPEIDRAAWFDLAAARPKFVSGQAELLDRLVAEVGIG